MYSGLGFATRGLAANLYLATGMAVTDLSLYINSELVFSDLKFLPLFSEIAAVEFVILSGIEPILHFETTWLLSTLYLATYLHWV